MGRYRTVATLLNPEHAVEASVSQPAPPARLLQRYLPGLLLILATLPATAGGTDEAARVRQLEAEVEHLRERLARLEARLPDARESNPGSGSVRLTERPVEEGSLAGATTGAESDTDDLVAAPAPEPSSLRIGGALRFTARYLEDSSASRTRWGESGLDLFRLNVGGELDRVRISAELRHYPFMDTLKHGWIGYAFDDRRHVEVGVTRVPFGLLPYASHSFWFGSTYYLGFEDDHDLGVKYVREDGPLDLRVALFKGGEFNDAGDLGRYAFDLVTDAGAPDEESNRVNARVAHTFGRESGCRNEVGVSGQYGELYNSATDEDGDAWAAAAHLDSRCGRWNLQLQGLRYDFDPHRPAGAADDVVRMGAFEASYDVAAEATVWTANVAYNFDVSAPWLDSLVCYNDFSTVQKDRGDFDDSHLNVTGCALGTGPVFTYVDVIRGRNAAFLGGGSLGGGGEDDWTTRLNLNVGYYW